MYRGGLLILFLCIVCTHAVCPKTKCTDLSSCWEHGECVIAGDGSETCTCDPGWSGASCNTRTCSGATCVNGDCCSSGCCCYPGWSGSTCDVFVGPASYNAPVCTGDGNCVCDSIGTPCSTVFPLQTVGVDLRMLSMQREHVQLTYQEADACDCRIGSGFYLSPGIRKIIRFSAYIENAGNAHLFHGLPLAPDFTFDCTNVPEYSDWISIKLAPFTESAPATLQDVLDFYAAEDLMPTGNPEPVIGKAVITYGNVVANFTKPSVIQDQMRINGAPTGKRFGPSYQGLSVGWGMSTSMTNAECSWLDVTDIPLGEYCLRLEVNPLHSMAETDYTNNVVHIPLRCEHDCGIHGGCNFGHGCLCDAGWGGEKCDKDLTLYPVCVPSCYQKACGSDGCGGECGYCRFGSECNSGTGLCVCVPQCTSNECGPDGCGDKCGSCRKQGTTCMDCVAGGFDCVSNTYSCMPI